jgi:hypothetical protein
MVGPPNRSNVKPLEEINTGRRNGKNKPDAAQGCHAFEGIIATPVRRLSTIQTQN